MELQFGQLHVAAYARRRDNCIYNIVRTGREEM